MSEIFPNVALQSTVDYSAVARAGAFNPNVPHNIDSKTFGANVTAGQVFPYGSFVAQDVNGGFKLPISGTTTAALIAGVVAYLNNGVTEDQGLAQGGLYVQAPILTFGRIFVPVTSGASLQIGQVVSLNLASGANFNTVRPLPGSPASSDVDISSIATVASPSNGGFVELTINKYIQ